MNKRGIDFNLALFTLLLTFSLYGCQNESIINNDPSPHVDESQNGEKKCDFIVRKDFVESSNGKELHLAIHLMEAIANISNEYSLNRTPVNSWGYSGGNQGTMISKGDKNLLVIIPSYTDTILAYIVISDLVCLDGGIKIGSSVEELESYYGTLEYHFDLMTGYESCKLPNTNIHLIFETSENNRVGVYNDIESPSHSVNKNITIDRIVLAK